MTFSSETEWNKKKRENHSGASINQHCCCTLINRTEARPTTKANNDSRACSTVRRLIRRPKHKDDSTIFSLAYSGEIIIGGREGGLMFGKAKCSIIFPLYYNAFIRSPCTKVQSSWQTKESKDKEQSKGKRTDRDGRQEQEQSTLIYKSLRLRLRLRLRLYSHLFHSDIHFAHCTQLYINIRD